jgi:site-specific DNA recombinase
MRNNKNNLRYIEYCRKSTDSEDRQVQSIEDQEKELGRVITRDNLNIIKTFGESKTAKKPGRPMFNEMMNMIERGEADGIICWKVNRLSRNPIDGGKIQWLLQQGIIKSIITPSREYLPTDNVLMMAVELGVANQFILDLSKDVKRGIKSKVEKGWRPGRAPIGYMNDKYGEKGQKKVFVDNDNFTLVRKMWDLLLTGNYSVKQIIENANDDWGMRNRYGEKFSLSVGYKILTNTFYYGEFMWEGEIYQGKHKPMITPKEFDKAQKILGKKGKARPKNKRLPFNGVIRCGECGAMITSEEKFKRIKSTDELRSYIYHHCTHHKKNTNCQQKSVRHKELKKQIEKQLNDITIPPEFLEFTLQLLREQNEIEEDDRNQILKNQQNSFNGCVQRIDNLIKLYISPENTDKDLMDEKEFKEQKNMLITEKKRIEKDLRETEMRVDEWVEKSEKTFNFATYAKYNFDKGDFEIKTQILRAFGQNFLLKDGILTIEPEPSYLIIKKGLEDEEVKKAMLEPQKFKEYAFGNRKNSRFATAFSRWSG